jgi:hypothetical protein
MARAVVASLALLLAACGHREGFDGTFSGTYQGDPVTLTLKVEGSALTGAMQWRGVNAIVAGTLEGNRAQGTVRQPVMGVEVPFDATLDGDSLDWTYTYVVSGEKVPLKLSRIDEAIDRGAIDPDIVGRWEGADGTVAVLNVDGTLTRGTARGRWKCEGSVLHTRADGGGRWEVWGRYVLADRELSVYAPDGVRQVFRRD